MRIPCPYCGSRDIGEFAYRGDATLVRPEGDDGAAQVESAMFEYVYLRDNPMGAHQEHWYHAQGCRNWLVVTRDMLTHDIPAARFAPGASA
jgi:sarcosine oxidase subunit delta